MNKPLLFAALLSAFTAAVHFFVGGAEIVEPLLASTYDDRLKLTLYAVWHMATVALLLSAVAFYFGALPRHATSSRALVLFLSALWAAFGLVFILVALPQMGLAGLAFLPQWTLLLAVSLLAFWGWRKTR